MFVARETHHNCIITGDDVELLGDSQKTKLINNIVCPACDDFVEYQDASKNGPLGCFTHKNGSNDCFASDVVSDEHRLCAEIVLGTLHNRVNRATEMAVDIDLEKQIGDCSNFVITDVKITSPIKLAAEVFYKTPRLDLSRRLSTMFRHGYGVYLIICTGGSHDPDRIQRDLSCLTSCSVGYFEPQTTNLYLGDLFTSDNIDMKKLNYGQAPKYIIS